VTMMCSVMASLGSEGTETVRPLSTCLHDQAYSDNDEALVR
jgi:hypothetical protein